MKKIFTSIALFGLLAVGCTKSDNVLDNGPEAPGANVETATTYLTMGLATPSGMGSRADIDGTYESGTGAETAVKDIRFYFFDAQGGPAFVRKNPANPDGFDSYYDYNEDFDHKQEGAGDADATIEKTINLTLQLSLPKDDDGNAIQPKFVVAIINPSKAALINTNPSLTELEAVVSDFDPAHYSTNLVVNQPNQTYTDGSFVMSNSVYAATTPALTEETAGAATSTTLHKVFYSEVNGTYQSLEEAAQHKTKIYVERVMARLDLIVGGATQETGDDGQHVATNPYKLIAVKAGVPANYKYKDDKNQEQTGTVTYNGTKYVEKHTGSTDADKDKNVFFTGTFYKAYNANDDDPAQPVFVKFHGWTVVSTPKKSNLMKNVDAAWDAELFGEETGFKVNGPWNTDNYYRSFWAINPTLKYANDVTASKAVSSDADYYFYSYNTIKNLYNFKNSDTSAAAGTIYIQENAAKSGEYEYVDYEYESKVIVAAELLNADGEPMEIAEYAYKNYKKDDLLKSFGDLISKTYYTKDAEGNVVKFDGATDLEYKTQFEHKGVGGVNHKGSYFAYVELSDAAKGKTWYREVLDPDSDTDPQGTKEVIVYDPSKSDTEKAAGIKAMNDFIEGVVSNRLLIWRDGMTYYYFSIRHLGVTAPTPLDSDLNDPNVGVDTEKTGDVGYYGVVRNHIYKANISGLFGLGTPVLDPNETIYPEKPKHDDYVLATEIKVLQWRVVSQDYEFSW